MTEGDDGARVFISYSRRDLDVAEPLRDALVDAGFRAYLDIHDIGPGEPWRERLGALIAAAEKVVFLISPNSVASEICVWEVDHAERLGKSLLPVVIRETATDAIPGRLSRLNFIFMRQEIETEVERTAGVSDLAKALSVDLAWEREKTSINDLAMAWDRAGRPRRLLMYAEDGIRAAERWRDSHPATSPAPTEIQLAFIAESRARQIIRQRTTIFVAVGVAVFTAALLVVTLIQWNAAVAERDRAQSELSRSYARQAFEMLSEGRHDAASILATQARAASPTPQANVVAYMTPEPSYHVEARLQLPVRAIDRIWVDPDRRYLAVRSSETNRVSIFDLSSNLMKPAYERPLELSDPFAIITHPHPSIIFKSVLLDGDEATSRTELSVASLPSNSENVIGILSLETKSIAQLPFDQGVGYLSFTSLSGGKFLYSVGSSIYLLELSETPKLKQKKVSLSGHVNRGVASPGSSCVGLSDVSGQIEILYADERPSVQIEAHEFLNTLEDGNSQHAQLLMDRDCRRGAIWFDGGRSGRVHLAQFLDAGGVPALKLIRSFDADPDDDIDFENRYFAREAGQFVFRQGGRWFVHDAETGDLTRVIEAGAPEATGALDDAGSALFVSSFDDVVSRFPLAVDGGDERFQAGRAPLAAAGRFRDTGDDWLVAVNAEGIASIWRRTPFEDRFDSFPFALPSAQGETLALSHRGDWLVAIKQEEEAAARVLLQRIDTNEFFELGSPCPTPVAITAKETSSGLVVFLGANDGRLCRLVVSHEGELLTHQMVQLSEKVPVDFLMLDAAGHLTAGNLDARVLYSADFENGFRSTRISIPESASARGLKTVRPTPESNGLAIFGDGGLYIVGDGPTPPRQIPSDCDAFLGVARGSDALFVCQQPEGFGRQELRLVDPAGQARRLDTPSPIIPLGAAVSPDGSVLLAPLLDEDNQSRRILGLTFADPSAYVFEPAFLSELFQMLHHDIDVKLEIENIVLSPSGERAFFNINVGHFEEFVLSNGSLNRFSSRALRRDLLLEINTGLERALFTYMLGRTTAPLESEGAVP